MTNDAAATIQDYLAFVDSVAHMAQHHADWSEQLATTRYEVVGRVYLGLDPQSPLI